MPIEKWFQEPQEKPIPPDARRWEAKFRVGPKRQCLFDRPREGLVFRPARLILLIKDEKDELLDSLDAPWSGDLNEWAVAKGIQCEQPTNESERFGFALQDKFSSVVLRYGDGFFNAVLIQHLRAEGLDGVAPVSEKLARIHEPRPANGDNATDCAQLIDQVIQDAAHDLIGKLTYPKEQAAQLLTGAIAYYLDERFNITNADLLGFGRH